MAKKEYVLFLETGSNQFYGQQAEELGKQLDNEGLDAHGIKKVFYYRNMLICVVDLEDLTGKMYSSDSTAEIKPIVNKLFPSEHSGPVMFTWAAVPRDMLTNLDLNGPKIEPAPGNSSGAGLRSD